MKRILVAEDDPRSQRLIGLLIESEGWEHVPALDGEEAWRIYELDEHSIDVPLLDVRMPRMGGIELTRRIRAASDIPIIIVSALDRDEQLLAGFNAGADDYLVKPLNAKVLAAKIRRALRWGGEREQYACGELLLDPDSLAVSRRGEPIVLTSLEFRLLQFLLANQGHIVSPDQIFRALWREDRGGTIGALRTAVLRLRRKIEDDSAASCRITTHVGLGYRIAAGSE